MSVFSIADLQMSGPISNHSGMTHLPEMIAHLDIDLPSRQDTIFKVRSSKTKCRKPKLV